MKQDLKTSNSQCQIWQKFYRGKLRAWTFIFRGPAQKLGALGDWAPVSLFTWKSILALHSLTNNDPKGQIFLSTPHINDVFFFLTHHSIQHFLK